MHRNYDTINYTSGNLTIDSFSRDLDQADIALLKPSTALNISGYPAEKQYQLLTANGNL